MSSSSYSSFANRLAVTLIVSFFLLMLPGAFGLPVSAASTPRNSFRLQGQSKLVLAFYYAWYSPESFGRGLTPFQPLNPYHSSETAVIQRHVDDALSAGIDGFVQSWYGPAPNQTESNFRALLEIASAKGFRVAVDFETGGPFFSSNEDRISALSHLLNIHASHPAYLRVDGKPVIFFWANGLLSVSDWSSIRKAVDPDHKSVWIAEGSQTEYLAVFDGLHLYNIAWSPSPGGVLASWAERTRQAGLEYGANKYWVATAMPGFDNSHLRTASNATKRDRANGTYFRDSFSGAVATAPDMLVITSFNEWTEGSNIEPSTEFGRYYLDLAADLSSAFKAGVTPSMAPAVVAPFKATQTTSNSLQLSNSDPPQTEISPTPLASPTADADGTIAYLVQPGDTLLGIATRFNLTLNELLSLNGIDENAILTIGQRIVLGRLQEGVVRTPEPEFADATVTSGGEVIYQVKEGDTLLDIALKYGLTLEELLELNPDMSPETLLRIGRTVTVGIKPRPAEIGGSTDSQPTPTVSLTAASPSEPTAMPSPTSTPVRSAAPSSLVPTPTSASANAEPIESQPDNSFEGLPGGPQTIMIVVVILVALGGTFLYLGRR